MTERIDGYAAIGSYAAIGDGRTVALIADDGSVDWLPLPELDSPSVFCAMLDAASGGRFALSPEVPYSVERRYLPGTDLLETLFSTDRGRVRVTDAMTVPSGGLGPLRELARRIEGLAGSVPMAWSVEPRFDFAGVPTRFGWRADVPAETHGGDAVAVCSFDAGAPELADAAIHGRFEAREGTRAVVMASAGAPRPRPSSSSSRRAASRASTAATCAPPAPRSSMQPAAGRALLVTSVPRTRRR